MAYTCVLGAKDAARATLNSEYGKRELPLACQDSHGKSYSIPASRVRSSFTQKRVLCVDDDVLELALRGKILELPGYSVALLSCSLQALRCDLSTFDLAILDFRNAGSEWRRVVAAHESASCAISKLVVQRFRIQSVSRREYFVFSMPRQRCAGPSPAECYRNLSRPERYS